MNYSYDIVTVGEALIDFVSKETSDGNHLSLTGNPGGAPANVLAAASLLGKKTALITKVGNDAFGFFLKRQIASSGVATDYVISDPDHPTTLAMVTLDTKGNRSFSFYRNETADVMLTPDELPREVITSARIFHFGSVTMTSEPARSATFAAVRLAKEHNCFISCDPNLRKNLWKDLTDAKFAIEESLRLSDAVKLSDDELEFLTESGTLEERAYALADRLKIKFLIVTMGPDGSFCLTRNQIIQAKAYTCNCIDTTGAGDAFWGAALSCFLETECKPWEMTENRIAEILAFSNAAGALATTKFGAIPALPKRDEIEHRIRTASDSL